MSTFNKYKGLGIINVLASVLGLSLCYYFSPLPWRGNVWDSINQWKTEPFPFILFILIPFIVSVCTLYFAYLLFRRNHSLPTKLQPVMIILPFTIVWIILYFLGYIFIIYPVVFLFLILFITFSFIVLKKFSISWALAITVLTLYISFSAISGNFEEEYCIQKANKIAAASPTTVIPANEEEKKHGFTEVSIHYREHMKCHQTFNVTHALIETYIR